MSGVRFTGLRQVYPNGCVRMKWKTYYDPTGRLLRYVGAKVKVENPYSWKTEGQELEVRDKNDFYICKVIPLPPGYRAIPEQHGVTLKAL